MLIIEGMAQTAAAMMMSLPEIKGHFAYFAGIRAAKFRRKVVPGDVLKYHVEIVRIKNMVGKVRGRAFVENALAAEAELTFAVD
jgi:3-hydroxyacyl-[acyl-carrier-protein] dehydratase